MLTFNNLADLHIAITSYVDSNDDKTIAMPNCVFVMPYRHCQFLVSIFSSWIFFAVTGARMLLARHKAHLA